jgi:hypothetical protein
MSKETGVNHAKFKKTEGQMKERDNDLLVDRPTTATSVLPSPPPPPSPHLSYFKLVWGERVRFALSPSSMCVFVLLAIVLQLKAALISID